MQVTIRLHCRGEVLLTHIGHVYPTIYQSTQQTIDITDLVDRIQETTRQRTLPPETHRPTLDDLPDAC